MSLADLSRRDLLDIVGPRLLATTGGELEIVEWEGTDLAGTLDVGAGIDFLIKRHRAPIISVASRIQWRHRNGRSAPWANGPAPMTFTIRLRTSSGETWTEMNKRLAARANGGMMPDWTLQAYMDQPGGPLENMGWMSTAELYDEVKWRYDNGTLSIHDNDDGSQFTDIKWIEIGGFRWFRPRERPVVTQPHLWQDGLERP